MQSFFIQYALHIITTPRLFNQKFSLARVWEFSFLSIDSHKAWSWTTNCTQQSLWDCSQREKAQRVVYMFELSDITWWLARYVCQITTEIYMQSLSRELLSHYPEQKVNLYVSTSRCCWKLISKCGEGAKKGSQGAESCTCVCRWSALCALLWHLPESVVQLKRCEQGWRE